MSGVGGGYKKSLELFLFPWLQGVGRGGDVEVAKEESGGENGHIKSTGPRMSC